MPYRVEERSELGIEPDDLRDYYFKNGKPELKHGCNEIYYESGSILGRGNYENGVRVGAWQFYYENGGIWQRGFYASNGYRLSNGDTWQYYDEEGNLEPFSRKQRC